MKKGVDYNIYEERRRSSILVDRPEERKQGFKVVFNPRRNLRIRNLVPLVSFYGCAGRSPAQLSSAQPSTGQLSSAQPSTENRHPTSGHHPNNNNIQLPNNN
eukprot:scaffold94_cov242-Ochromonas_danica.AAC.2